MDIIIVGCGRVGQTLAEKLNSDGNNVTMIDVSAEKIKMLTHKYDVMGIVGNGAIHSIQQEAGIETADLFIAVTNSDELNLLCCMIAKKAGSCQTIARLKKPEYSTEMAYLQDELGLAMVINPEYAAAEEIARVLRFPQAVKIEPFSGGKIELIKFKLPKESTVIGMSVRDMMVKYHFDVLVCTIERGEESYIANGDFVFAEKDIVSIVATPKNAHQFFSKINCKGHAIKDAMIVGGGTISQYLCDILSREGISLKLIEKDAKLCAELSAKWPKVSVIHGDVLERELLLEEGVARTGAFVSLCGLDEENILLSLYAKDAGSGKQITKITRMDYDSVLSRLELDTVICPKNITADTIVSYVRATTNTKGSNVETLYNIVQDKVEAAEFVIKGNSPVIGKPLHELKFKKDILVASISRGDTVIIPRGNDVIEEGDAVVIVSKNLGLKDVSDILR